MVFLGAVKETVAAAAKPAARWMALSSAVLVAAGSAWAVAAARDSAPRLTTRANLVGGVGSPAQATATPEPGWQTGVFFGLYASDFEVSSFVPGTDAGVLGCPGYGVSYWLQGSETFYKRFRAIYPVQPPYPQMEQQIVYTRFYGRLSPPGRYGHLGGYEHEIRVLYLIDMAPTTLCGAAPTPVVTPDRRPDLVIADAQRQMAGFNGRCVPRRAGPELHVCVGNDGVDPAGPFTVTTDSDPITWRLAGLPGGESLCLAPRGDSLFFGSNVWADADDEVDEADEYNNGVQMPDDEAMPPPLCQETPTPTPALPDLVVADAWQTMTGFGGYCISVLAPLETTVCVRNQGGRAVGPFAIQGDGGLAWSVQELGVNETHCVAPQRGSPASVTVDPDNAVPESDETNNAFVVPMATPPNVCTPIPAGTTGAPVLTPPAGTPVTPTFTPSPAPSVAPTDTPTIPDTPTPWRVLLPYGYR
jgi:hypothetical protein